MLSGPVTTGGTIDLALDGEVSVVAVRGEHDLATADALRRQLEELRAQGSPFVVDLTEATFIDSAVLGVLIGEHDRAVEYGLRAEFVVGEGSGYSVRKIIDLAGVRAVLPISETRDAALAAIRGG
jgi:anti-sigma B factor antagonist